MAFQIVQILYWLALSTWFGGVLFIALAAPIIFRVVREANPIMPNVLSVNLDGQHATLLAGNIVSSLLNHLTRIQLACAGVMLLTLIAHPFLIDMNDSNLTAAILRCGLFLAAVGMVIVDWRFLWPKIEKSRQTYLEHADEPEVANPAKEEFDREHRTSVTILSAVLCALLGIVLFSGSITPKKTVVPYAASNAQNNQ